MAVIPALQRLRQKGCEFKANLGCTEAPNLKTNNKNPSFPPGLPSGVPVRQGEVLQGIRIGKRQGMYGWLLHFASCVCWGPAGRPTMEPVLGVSPHIPGSGVDLSRVPKSCVHPLVPPLLQGRCGMPVSKLSLKRGESRDRSGEAGEESRGVEPGSSHSSSPGGRPAAAGGPSYTLGARSSSRPLRIPALAPGARQSLTGALPRGSFRLTKTGTAAETRAGSASLTP